MPCHAVEAWKAQTREEVAFSRKLRRRRYFSFFPLSLMPFLTVIDMYGSFFWWTNSSYVHHEHEDETAGSQL